MACPPRLVFVLSAYALGGAEKQLAALIEHRPARARHIELHTVTLLGHVPGEVSRRFGAAGVTHTFVDREASSAPVFFLRLLQAVRRLRPQLVHTVLDSSPGTWGRLAARLAGVPVVFHSDRSLRSEGTWSHRLLRPTLDRLTDRFMPNAQAIAERLVSTGVPRSKIEVVPNGVDLTVFEPGRVTASRASVGGLTAGFLGRFDPVKRLDVLLDALLALPERERPVRVVLGGDGPVMPELRERVAADPWLADHCQLPGAITDVPAFLAGIDYLVHPSEVEGLPNAVLEAMAMARPIVATRVSDVPALVEGAGFLAEPGDAASLAEAIRAMQGLPDEERARLGAAARRRIERDHDIDRIAERFWDAHLARFPDPRRVALYLPNLVGGGAECVTLNLAHGLSEAGARVDLVLARAYGPFLERVPAGVSVVDLGAARTAASLPALVRYLRRERPAALLSALNHANIVAIAAARLARYRGRLLVAEHNAPHGHLSTKQRATNVLVRLTYPLADGVVAVSEGVKEGLARTTGLSPERVQVIYNPVLTPELRTGLAHPATHPFLDRPPVVLGIGRLTAQKDFANLLEAFAQLRERLDARLIVLGEGEERAALERLAAELGIEGAVSMPGFVPNPYGFLARADLFVLSSDWEGLPTVLIEALSACTPVVATDCPCGPREILDGGRLGELVPVRDSHALAEAMERALRRGRRAVDEAWLEPFTLGHATERYARAMGLVMP